MSRLYDHSGASVRLDRLLGRGGEGSVYQIASDSDRVAKLYHSPVSTDKAEKLVAMSRLASPALTGIGAWPTGTLHAAPGGQLSGILMPRINGHKEIHHLYGPAHRKQDFPHADWLFLIHAARNVAAAFVTIHAAGHVVGDVNQGNIVVSPQATVRLIDCDSFQIRANERVFKCEVGVPHFTPPELQNHRFAEVVRTPNHDAFGLAVLLFHLVFMGRHPFAGKFLDNGHMPIEKAIQQHRFAFGAGARYRKMQPPPNTLPLTAASIPLSLLFERAFAPEGASGASRPTPIEWLVALDQLRSELRTCARSTAHKYHHSLSGCPWCEIEKVGGPSFFVTATTHIEHGARFNAAAAWAEILRVTPPRDQVPLPSHAAIATRSPTQLTRSLGTQSTIATLAGWGAILFAALAIFGLAGAWLLAVPLTLGWFGLNRFRNLSDEVRRRKSAYQRARADFESTDARLKDLARNTTQVFQQKRAELERLHKEYDGLDNARTGELAMLKHKQEAIQRRKYLERQFIDRANIPGIGPGRKATLASYGIETAADIGVQALARIPGFGDKLIGELMAWRTRLEARFHYLPSQTVDPADVAAIEQKYARRRQELKRALSAGPHELRRLVSQAGEARQDLSTDLQQRAQAMSRARAELIR